MSTINLDQDSIKAICGDSQQAFVYGFGHCKYVLMEELLLQPGSSIAQTFSGDRVSPHSYATTKTIEGRNFEIIYSSDNLPRVGVFCKNGLASVVVENLRRQSEKLPRIPLLFFIDIDGNEYSGPTPISVTTKEPTFNGLYTHAEIRRAYKLCYDPAIDPEIQSVARKTFEFIKLTKIADNTYGLEKQQAPWEQVGWDDAWVKRQEVSVSTEKEPKENWRYQVNNLARKVRGEAPILPEEFSSTSLQQEKIGHLIQKLSSENAYQVWSKAQAAFQENPEFQQAVLDKILPEEAYKVLKVASDSLKDNIEFMRAVLNKIEPKYAYKVLADAGVSVKSDPTFPFEVLAKSSAKEAGSVLKESNVSCKNNLKFISEVLKKIEAREAYQVLENLDVSQKNKIVLIRRVLEKSLPISVSLVLKYTPEASRNIIALDVLKKSPLNCVESVLQYVDPLTKDDPNFAETLFDKIKDVRWMVDLYKNENPAFNEAYTKIILKK
ncbi:MAG: hypothetical protein WCG10_00715 [Chlamydiota bacterium]